jgi:hypothetical protein
VPHPPDRGSTVGRLAAPDRVPAPCADPAGPTVGRGRAAGNGNPTYFWAGGGIRSPRRRHHGARGACPRPPGRIKHASGPRWPWRGFVLYSALTSGGGARIRRTSRGQEPRRPRERYGRGGLCPHRLPSRDLGGEMATPSAPTEPPGTSPRPMPGREIRPPSSARVLGRSASGFAAGCGRRQTRPRPATSQNRMFPRWARRRLASPAAGRTWAKAPGSACRPSRPEPATPRRC